MKVHASLPLTAPLTEVSTERLTMLLRARNGGSIPPRFHKTLQAHITHGALSIHTHTTIPSQSWDPDLKTWTIEITPPITNLPSRIDYIYYATGIKPDITTLPFLSPLHSRAPIKTIGGFPCLTNDLAWSEDIPLFVAGRLAGLRVGPDCGNLEGARVGAERISWAVQEVLERGCGDNGAAESEREVFQRMGSVNMFESLGDA